MATQAASMKKRGARKRKTTAAIPYASKLGVNANNTLELIGEIEEGFSYQAFEELQGQLELSISELADLLQIPRRTLSRRKHEGKLPPDESERLLRFLAERRRWIWPALKSGRGRSRSSSDASSTACSREAAFLANRQTAFP